MLKERTCSTERSLLSQNVFRCCSVFLKVHHHRCNVVDHFLQRGRETEREETEREEERGMERGGRGGSECERDIACVSEKAMGEKIRLERDTGRH